jgi:hypothetical protein
MTIYSNPLWFDSCVADAFMTWAITGLVLIAIAVAVEWMRRRAPSGPMRNSGRGLQYGFAILFLAVTVMILMQPFPPRFVQIAMADGQIALRVCNRFSDVRQVRRLDELTFRYVMDERGTQKIRHHMLVVGAQGAPEPIGSIEFLPESRFDFTALQKIAPAALAQYRSAAKTAR